MEVKMATTSATRPSFSPGRKWAIGLNVFVSLVAVVAVVVMANYLSGRYSRRFYLSGNTRLELHGPTLSLLRSITNKVRVTLYYDKDADFYNEIADLLNQYHDANPRLTVRQVDYLRDPGLAQELKMQYKQVGSATNLVIFDCGGHVKLLDGNALASYTLESLHTRDREFRRKPLYFMGEMMFDGALLAVTSPKPLQAYCLEGHGEHRIEDTSDDGYSTFKSILEQNYVAVHPLSLLGTNTVPADCNLLIIAGPAVAIPDVELEKITQYLDQSGRLFALFDARSAGKETGLEKVLAKWGVVALPDLVVDQDNLVRGRDIVISAFTDKNPAVNPIIGSGLYMTLPHPIGAAKTTDQAADAPKVEPIAFTGPRAYLYSDANRQLGRFPVMVAVEKSAKGVISDRGASRMLIAGDSFFLSNGQIDKLSNRDFVSSAANWLLDRTTLMHGLAPRPITEYYVTITRKQMQAIEWILLGALPGCVLLFGGVVWVRRRR